jgi:hypothetical protein
MPAGAKGSVERRTADGLLEISMSHSVQQKTVGDSARAKSPTVVKFSEMESEISDLRFQIIQTGSGVQ